MSDQRFWDNLYNERDQVWSGRPNTWLTTIVGELPPGRALDLGCGEGGDAIWLAERGWAVTAVDITDVALGRLRKAAAEHGVAERIRAERHDLETSFPDGEFDLVSAQFFQSPVEFPRAEILRKAAHTLVPGGLLLVVDHGAAPPWSKHAHEHTRFSTPDEVYAALDLDAAAWRSEIREARERATTDPDGRPATLLDNVLAVRRLG
ncbi:class I SAM-dependent methyltransferase [Nocardia sp. NPDC004068]|uniref:class I SAM-dependent methyltransferase n=1 Tax=Nocardia sp. NPDC004068 TaxID=3364303 RepID=UPI0036931DF1